MGSLGFRVYGGWVLFELLREQEGNHMRQGGIEVVGPSGGLNKGLHGIKDCIDEKGPCGSHNVRNYLLRDPSEKPYRDA